MILSKDLFQDLYSKPNPATQVKKPLKFGLRLSRKSNDETKEIKKICQNESSQAFILKKLEFPDVQLFSTG